MTYKMPPLDALAEKTDEPVDRFSWLVTRDGFETLEIKIVKLIPGYGGPSVRPSVPRPFAATTVELRGPQPWTPEDIASAIQDAAWELMMRHAPKLLPPLELPEIEGAVFGEGIVGPKVTA